MMFDGLCRRVRPLAPLVLGFVVSAATVPLTSEALDLTLAWDPSAAPGVAGYNVYYGVMTRSYTNMIQVGNATSAVISNLPPGVSYYFAATAYDGFGLESDFSAEATYVPGTNSFNIPPTLDPVADMNCNENSGIQIV